MGITLFLDTCSKQAVDVSLIGYIAALLPFRRESVIQVLRQALPGDEASNQFLWTSEMIPDSKNAVLLFVYFATVLKHVSGENEKQIIYDVLKEGVKFMPSAFPTTYPILVEKLSSVLNSGQNPSIVSSVISIINHMFSFEMESVKKKSKSTSYLQEIGFSGLPKLAMFLTSNQKRANTKSNISFSKSMPAVMTTGNIKQKLASLIAAMLKHN